MRLFLLIAITLFALPAHAAGDSEFTFFPPANWEAGITGVAGGKSCKQMTSPTITLDFTRGKSICKEGGSYSTGYPGMLLCDNRAAGSCDIVEDNTHPCSYTILHFSGHRLGNTGKGMVKEKGIAYGVTGGSNDNSYIRYNLDGSFKDVYEKDGIPGYVNGCDQKSIAQLIGEGKAFNFDGSPYTDTSFTWP